MKQSMTNFDINAMVCELTNRLSGSELKNIFEINDMFFFRFRTRKEGTQLLVIELGKRIHLTRFKRSFPESPSGLCKAFRTHIKGKWLKSIYQYDFDRVCVLEFEAYDQVYTLIIELFGKGNLILISPESKILVAKNYKKMRDRDIHPGIEFQFPPSLGQNFMEADLEWVKEQLTSERDKDLMRAISKTMNINKDYAREICLKADIDPMIKTKALSKELLEKIIASVKALRAIATSENLEPMEYLDPETNELIDITPFPLMIHSDLKPEKKESFSEALDEFFSTKESDKVSEVELSAEAKKIKQIIAIRRKQEDHLQGLQKTVEEEKAKGDLVYLHLAEVDELLTTITNARRKNIEWAEIKEKLGEAKKQGLKGARILDEILEKEKTVVVKLEGKNIRLDFLKSASENANIWYNRAKKAESKMPGAQKKIKELTERIKRLEDGLEELAQKEKILVEKRKKEWFEKFHWFKSSDGFLVIAGKDSRLNIALVKKHLEKDDLFLHAEIHGAAVVVIKGEGRTISQKTLDEAAIFSVSYSRAWKEGQSSANTYWVKPEQVSFSAPSGEYLAKGSFIIRGSKNLLKNIPLEIAVYPIIEEKWAYVIAAPYQVLKTSNLEYQSKIVSVIPGDISKSKVAKTIVQRFLEGLDEKDQAKIKATALNELISILPGNCYMKKDQKD